MSLSETLSFWKLFFVLFHICHSDKFFCWRFTPFLNFAVHGALRCLALLSVDLDDTVVPTLIPALFPCLLTIVSSPQVSIICLLFQLIVFELFSIWRQVKLLCNLFESHVLLHMNCGHFVFWGNTFHGIWGTWLLMQFMHTFLSCHVSLRIFVSFSLPCGLLWDLFVQVYDKYLRTKSFSIVYSCITVLGVMSGVYKVFDLFSILMNFPQSEVC